MPLTLNGIQQQMFWFWV